MRLMQQQIISDLNVSVTIDARTEIDTRVGFLVDYLEKAGAKGYVLGVSGGQDSTLAGRLCQLAVEQVAAQGTEAEFVAMRLPYATQRDEDDAQLALSFIRAQRVVTFNIQRAVDGFEGEYGDAVGDDMTDFTKGNVKARSRMIAQYAIEARYEATEHKRRVPVTMLDSWWR